MDAIVVSVTKVAELLGISRAHAYRLIAVGDLPNVRLGRRIVVPIELLRLAMNAHASGEDPPQELHNPNVQLRPPPDRKPQEVS